MEVTDARVNFVRQQGYTDVSAAVCGLRYPALMFQPRLVGVIVIVGVVLRSPWIFLGLSIVLWWSALVPRWSPFDALYNALIADRRGHPRLTPAPRPRRFAQATAATVAIAIAVSLRAGRMGLAVGLELFLLAAIAALVFGAFCFGSFVFHVLTGNAGFATRTLPWVRGSMERAKAE